MTSQKCQFPGGCNNLVRVENGSLCHHHKRFTGRSGKMSKVPRLPSMIAAAREDREQVESAVEQGKRIMTQRPKLRYDPTNQRLYMNNWKMGDSFELDGMTITPPQTLGRVNVQPVQSGTNGWLIFSTEDGRYHPQDVLDMTGMVRRYSADVYGSRAGVYGISEFYDDEAEIIAQLELGKSKGYTVKVMSGKYTNRGMSSGVVNLSSGEGSDKRAFALEMTPEVDRISTDLEAGVMYRPTGVYSPFNQQLNEDETLLVNQIIDLRNLIESNGFRGRDGKIAMPVGWTEMEPPRIEPTQATSHSH